MNINTKSNLIKSTLDGAFDEDSSQREVFQKIEHYIPATTQGFNCTIFAYGQTGSGNTFHLKFPFFSHCKFLAQNNREYIIQSANLTRKNSHNVWV